MNARPRGAAALLDSRWFPVACLGVAFVLRLIWALLVDPKPVSDFAWYYDKAIDIARGLGYQSAGVPTAFWPVGYCAFLAGLFAVFGSSLLVVKLSNIVLYLGLAAAASWLAGRLFQSARTARLTLLLLAVYPNHIAYTSLAASEILFTFLMLLGIALIWLARSRFTWILPAGIVFGLACLVRPQLLPIPLVAIALLPRATKPVGPLGGRLFSLAALYAILLLVLVPWTIRNYKAFGHVILVSTNAGGNLLIGNNPWANGAYVERPEYDPILGEGNEYERDLRAKKWAMTYIREHPAEIARLIPRKLWYLYRGDVEGARWTFEGMEAAGKPVPEALGTAVVVVSEAYYVVLMAACAASVLLFVRRASVARSIHGTFPLLGLGVIAYFTFLGAMFYGGSRYHFPVMPWVAMFAAALPLALNRSREASPQAPGGAS